MKSIFYIFLLLLLGVGIGYLIFNPTPTPIKELNFAKPTPTPIIVKMTPNPGETYASFGIFTLGTFRSFTHPMYHNNSPDVYIEEKNPNIVIVKRPNTTWGFFFKTLPMLLTYTCLTTGTGQSYCTDEERILKFYLNGIEEPKALDKIIINGDKLLITYGTEPSPSLLSEEHQQIPNVK